MLYSLLLLLLLSNQIPEIRCPTSTSTPPCTWEYQWSDTRVLSALLPPNDTSCHLYFSDQLAFVNADSMDHMLFRVSTQAAFNNCDSSSPIHGESVAAGGRFSVTINGGDFMLSALDKVYMISEAISGSCYQLGFFINIDTNRDCDMSGACNFTSATQPTVTTTPPVAPMPNNGTQAPMSGAGGLSGVETFLVIACCFLFVADVVAVVVLVLLCVYLPNHQTCNITRGLRGGGDGGTELKPKNPPSWRQKQATN